MKHTSATIITSFFCLSSFAQQLPVHSLASLTNATVYYGQGAELQHQAKAALATGSQEIIIDNISTSVDQKTIQIACPENVVLLSSRFMLYTPPASQTSTPIAQRMQDSLKGLQKQIALLENNISIQNEILTKTGKLLETNYTASEKVINATELIKLTDYYNQKIQTVRNTIFDLQQKKIILGDSSAAISERLVVQQNAAQPVRKTVGQLALQVTTTAATTATFNITYFTLNAGWLPSYDVRVKTVDNSFKLVYKATVNQTTGIDWKSVKLTLSTGNPNQSSSAPILNALFVNAYLPTVYQPYSQSNMVLSNTIQSYRKKAVTGSTQEVVINKEGFLEKKDFDDETVEGNLVQTYTNLTESQLNTSFEIDLPYDIPTDGKAYSVGIKDEMVAATYKQYAVPKLDADAFLLAEISDWEKLNLMPGEANIVMDNVYLGRTFIDPNNTADTLNISLGRDKRISIKRNLLRDFSKSKTRDQSKTDDFTYEIVVKNNKKTAVDLLLKDQYPISKTKEVEITVSDKGEAEVNEDLGILNWKLQLAPGESKKLRFSYSIKYPKDKVIRNL